MRLLVPLRQPDCPVCGALVEATHYDMTAKYLWVNEHRGGRECVLTLPQYQEMYTAWRTAARERWASEL